MSDILGGIATGLTGGLLGAIGQNSANAFNAEQAAENRSFQEQMSNTAYQRATQDMQKAGINPMLAYMQGGASQPSGAQATGGNVGEAFTSGASSALGARQANAATDQAEATADTQQKQADKLASEKAGQDIDNALKPDYLKVAKQNAASSALSASKAGTNSIYNTGKQFLKDLGTNSSGKSALQQAWDSAKSFFADDSNPYKGQDD